MCQLTLAVISSILVMSFKVCLMIPFIAYSLSTVELNSRDQPRKLWLPDFCSIANFKILKFTCILSVCLPAFLPSVRHGYTICMAPEFLYREGNHVGFMKLLF